MKRRFFALLLVLALCLSLLPAVSAAYTERPYFAHLSHAQMSQSFIAGGTYTIHIPVYISKANMKLEVTIDGESGTIYTHKSAGALKQGLYDYTFQWNTKGVSTGEYYTSVSLMDTAGNDLAGSGTVILVVKNAIPLEGIDWWPESAVKGETINGGAPQPDPCNTTDLRNVTYTSLDPNILTVENIGGEAFFTGVNYGRARVTATISGKSITKEVDVCKDSMGHNIVGVDKQPTCTEPGLISGKCSKCGWGTETVIPATGHRWTSGDILVEEDGDTWGVQQEICYMCEATREVPYHTCPGEAFTDHVKDSNWAHKPIDFVVRQGLMTGTTATTFDPKMNLDRGQLVTILYRMNGSPKVENTETPFTDLNKNYYKKAVAWAYQNGIVTGTTATTFEPSTVVTREVFATMLYRYYVNYCHNSAGELADLSIFPDAGKTHSFARKPMAWAVANGIITGTGSALSPGGNATREQAAAILMRFLQNLPQG